MYELRVWRTKPELTLEKAAIGLEVARAVLHPFECYRIGPSGDERERLRQVSGEKKKSVRRRVHSGTQS